MTKREMMDVIVNAVRNSETLEELKTTYVVAMMASGGDADLVKKLGNMWKSRFPKVKLIHKTKEGKPYTRDTEEKCSDFPRVIETLVTLKGCKAEFCGTWLWVTGNTRENKETLKSLGFHYAAKKQAWYLAPQGAKNNKKHRKSLEEIRASHGTTTLADNTEVA